MKFLPPFRNMLIKNLFSPIKTVEINKLREQLLATLLYGIVAPGFVVYYIGVRDSFALQKWGLITAYTIAFGFILTITFYKRFSYYVRAGSLVGLLYILGTSISIVYGLGGDGRMWMMGFVTLAAIFFSPQISIIAAIIGATTLVSIGWALNQGLIPTQALFLNPMSSWIPTGITFLLVSLVIIGTIGYLLANLSERLEKEHDITNELEYERQELREKTTALEQKQIQLQTAAEISQAITSELDSDTIFQQTVTLITDRFDLYYAGIFILDEEKQYAVLQAGSGEAGHTMLAEGYKLPANESSTVGWAIVNKQARINLDIDKASVRFDTSHLPLTRSELGIPITSRGRILGALIVQSTEPQAFDENDIAILQTMADSLATSIDNARLYQESQNNLEEISTLHRQYLQQAWETVAKNRTDLTHFFVNERFTALEGETSTIEVPLILRGQQIGSLVLETSKPHLTAEEKGVLDSLATQAALALENARLIEATQQRSQRDRIVSEIAGKVQRASKVNEALKITLQELGQTLGASEGMIYLEINE